MMETYKDKEVPLSIIVGLINNSGEHLTEVNIEFSRDDSNKKLIRAIYKKCPNLKYLKVNIEKDDDILELENLFIKCQYLAGLYITCRKELNFENLFDKLVNSAPDNLFKFKFKSSWQIPLVAWKSFFYNWKGRPPMLLQTIATFLNEEYMVLFENYKFLGIIKKYDNCENENTFEDFEWITGNFNFMNLNLDKTSKKKKKRVRGVRAI